MASKQELMDKRESSGERAREIVRQYLSLPKRLQEDWLGSSVKQENAMTQQYELHDRVRPAESKEFNHGG